MNVVVCVSLYGFLAIAFKDSPYIRAFFSTGATPPPQVELLIDTFQKNHRPVLLEALTSVPLRENPPAPTGILPLRKGNFVTEVRPNSEWLVIDSMKVRKITGDDTWIRIASKRDIDRSLVKIDSASAEKIREILDNQSASQAKQKITSGWAYLGKNFEPEISE